MRLKLAQDADDRSDFHDRAPMNARCARLVIREFESGLTRRDSVSKILVMQDMNPDDEDDDVITDPKILGELRISLSQMGEARVLTKEEALALIGQSPEAEELDD